MQRVLLNRNLARQRRIFLLFERMTAGVCGQYGFSRTETDVLSFLVNNPGLDTARDIVEYRAIPKANVSQAVEQLIQKGMLTRRQDEKDRRYIHLALTPKAAQPAAALARIRAEYEAVLFRGFTAAELASYAALTERMMNNVEEELERI